MSTGIGVAIVGYGIVAKRMHIPLLRLADGLRLCGICSSDPAKRDEIRGSLRLRAYTSLEQTLADPDVQLIVLATPNGVHASQAIAALKSGKHVVVDKPMCLSTTEASAMVAASESNCRILSVFHNRRLDCDYLTLRHLIETGRISDIRWIEMAWQRYGASTQWRGRPEMGGGRLIDLGSHMIDQILQLFPAPVTGIFCRKHYDFPGAKIESHAMLSLSFEDGRTAVVDTTAAAYTAKPRLLALGRQSTFVKQAVDPQESALIAGDIELASESPEQFGRLYTPSGVTPIPSIPGRWRSYYENIAEVLNQTDPWGCRGRLVVQPSEAARVVAVLEYAQQSATIDRSVAVHI